MTDATKTDVPESNTAAAAAQDNKKPEVTGPTVPPKAPSEPDASKK